MAAPGCLVTRPEEGARGLAPAVAALGWSPVAAPALRLEPRPLGPLPAARALLLPSAAVLPALAGAAPAGLPLLAVGEGTARAARAAGFRSVEAAEGDAASLAALAARRLDPGEGPLLLLHGEGYGDALAADLAARGFSVLRRVAYAASELETLPKAARSALASGSVRAALFLSPRSARAACALLRRAGLAGAATGIRAVALSPRVAVALAELPWRGVDAASRPCRGSLLAALGAAPDPGREG